MASLAENTLDRELTELKRKFEAQIAAYIANLNDELRIKLANIKTDYYSHKDDTGIPFEDLERTLVSGKHALKGTIDAFFDDNIPDHEFSSSYGMTETISQICEDMTNHLRQDHSEEMENTFSNLKSATTRYNQGVKSEQETILDILRNDFDLDLVCL